MKKTSKIFSGVLGVLTAGAAVATTLGGGVAQADTSYGPIRVLTGTTISASSCLDVKTEDIAKTPVHARVQLWDCHGVSEQQWSSHPYATVTLPGGEFGSFNETFYQIRNQRTGYCLEIPNGTLTTGVQADVVPCGTGAPESISNQLWAETPFSRGFVLNPFSAVKAGVGRCLDLKGSNNDNGTPIQQWTCNQTNAQVFGGSLGG